MAGNAKKYTYELEAKYKGKGEVGRLKDDLKSLKQIDSMRQLGKDVLDLNRRFHDARGELEKQAAEMRQAGTATKEMSESYRKAQENVRKLAEQLDKKQAAYRASRESVKAAGIDTTKLAAEEKRLANAAKATGEVWAARQALGVRSHRDVRDEITRLRGAYDTLKRSGTLTSTELVQAQRHLQGRIRELRTQTVAWGGDLTKVHTGLLGLAGAGYAIGKAFSEYSGFETGMAEVYTLVDLSKDKFAEFKDVVRDVSKELPQDARDLTKALYDIVSAGVELQNSPKVLELSAKAATAGITETQTAANVGIGVMNAYGKTVGDLEGIYDVLFTTVKQGVTTFPALAQSIGEVVPTARTANIELPLLGAAIATLTKAGIKTPQAMTALKGAINAIAAPAPEAKKAFAELNITYGDFLSTIEQIREKGLSLEQMRMLIPDTEARTGVISLVQNFEILQEVLGSMDSSAGAMQTAYDKMADTPAHDIALMTKALKEMMTGIGELASVVILPAAHGITELVSAINDAPGPIKLFISLIGAAVSGGALWKLGLSQVVAGLGSLVTGIGNARTVMTGLTATSIIQWLAEMRTATLAAAASQTTLGLAMRATAAGGAAWGVVQIYEAAKAYLEMRDAQKQAAAAAEAAAASEAKYQERLRRASEAAGVTLSSYQEVRKAYRDGILDYNAETDTYTRGSGVRREAHRSVARAAKDAASEQKRVTVEVTEEMAAQYRKYVDEVKRLQDEIAGRKKSQAEELRAMGRTGMDGLSAWRDLKKEAQEYERAAQRAAQAGDFATAVQMADKATDKYKQLNAEVKDGDRVLVSQQTALKTAMDGVQRSGKLAIDALNQQKKAAEEAAKKLDLDAGGKLSKSVEGVVDGVKDVTAAGIDMGQTLVDSINKFGVEAAREFDDMERWLKSPHEMVITRRYQDAKSSGGMIGMASGGYLFMRNMLRGGNFPGFGGGDRRHVVAEDGEYMFDKFRVRDAGLSIVRAFHAGRYADVVAGLVDKFRINLGDIIKRRVGGPIARINESRSTGPQFMAGGGSVVGDGGSGEVITFRVQFNSGRALGPFSGPGGDATALLRGFQQALEASS